MRSPTEALADVVGIADPAAWNTLHALHAPIANLPAEHPAHARFVALIERAGELARGNRNGRLFVHQVDQAAAELAPLVRAEDQAADQAHQVDQAPGPQLEHSSAAEAPAAAGAQ